MDGLKALSFLRGDGEGLRGALSPLGTCLGDPARLRARVLSEAPWPRPGLSEVPTPRRSASAPHTHRKSTPPHPRRSGEDELSLQPAPCLPAVGAQPVEGEQGLGALRPGCSCPEGLCVLTPLAGTVPASLTAGGAQSSSRGRSGPSRAGARTAVCVCVYLFAAHVCVCARVHVMSGFPPVLWLMRLPAPRSGHSAAWTRVSARELSTLTGICSQRSRHHGLLPPPLHVIACSPPASHRSTRRCCSRHPGLLYRSFYTPAVRPGPRCHAGAVSAGPPRGHCLCSASRPVGAVLRGGPGALPQTKVEQGAPRLCPRCVPGAVEGTTRCCTFYRIKRGPRRGPERRLFLAVLSPRGSLGFAVCD